jgi:hypothetical protein
MIQFGMLVSEIVELQNEYFRLDAVKFCNKMNQVTVILESVELGYFQI